MCSSEYYCRDVYFIQNTLLSPPERSKICSTVLKMIQFPDKNLLSTCEALEDVLGRRKLVTWAKRIVEVHDKGIAGLMDLFQAADKLIDESPVSCFTNDSYVMYFICRIYIEALFCGITSTCFYINISRHPVFNKSNYI